MAKVFNVTEAHLFYLGEDKFLDIAVTGQDGVTPLDLTGLPLEWSLKKKAKDADPPLIHKASTGGTPGITLIGAYNVDPGVNTQKARISLASDDTDPFVTGILANPTLAAPAGAYTLKAGVEYHHSLKRRDVGNEGVLSAGTFKFKQATEQ